MKACCLTALLSVSIFVSLAQSRPPAPFPGRSGGDSGRTIPKRVDSANQVPKPYRDIITAKAVSHSGLFTVHLVGEKWYFEIADSLLHRDILVTTRFVKTPSSNKYGGEEINEQMIQWEKGPSDRLFLRVITLVNVAADSSGPIARAVANSNENTITAAFDIKAYGKASDSSRTSVIDVTDFFKGDNPVTGIPSGAKGFIGAGALAADRSYIQRIRTFPINTEVRTVKTYNAAPAAMVPAAREAGAVTAELNCSFLLLPATPMRRRLFDARVGYFTDRYTVFADDQQRSEISEFIHRWRMEPRKEDLEKWRRGELVEPQKPIVIYIDPATPRQWRPYLIAGINDWQVAFEKAGFKNAIMGREWPENDSTMSLEDARYSVLRYFASDITNAYGPNVADPRSGEILETHIGWYHNVMKLVHDWYMIQAGAVDPRARKMKFDETLMGDLVRFVSSHEVGHTLGLRHNMGSSSRTPVEKLRDKAWVEEHGHTASIMDYARFNYVAQPEDHIGSRGLYPRIGDYDKWAIQWGYQWIPGTKDEEEDKKILNRLALDSLKNPRLWFGGEGQNADPRAQTEDLGDNSVKASEYGIKNLKRILPQLPGWTAEEGDQYNNLREMYEQVVSQLGRYMGHVVKNVGGVYETVKSMEQQGAVYELTPVPIQKEAVVFLNRELFTTPVWLYRKEILDKCSDPGRPDAVSNLQINVLTGLLSSARLSRMAGYAGRYSPEAVYGVDELLDDVRKGIWAELYSGGAIDLNRRKLQKAFVFLLSGLMEDKTPAMRATDIPAVVRAQLEELKTRITAAMPKEKDKVSRYHLLQMQAQIRQALTMEGRQNAEAETGPVRH